MAVLKHIMLLRNYILRDFSTLFSHSNIRNCEVNHPFAFGIVEYKICVILQIGSAGYKIDMISDIDISGIN